MNRIPSHAGGEQERGEPEEAACPRVRFGLSPGERLDRTWPNVALWAPLVRRGRYRVSYGRHFARSTDRPAVYSGSRSSAMAAPDDALPLSSVRGAAAASLCREQSVTPTTVGRIEGDPSRAPVWKVGRCNRIPSTARSASRHVCRHSPPLKGRVLSSTCGLWSASATRTPGATWQELAIVLSAVSGGLGFLRRS